MCILLKLNKLLVRKHEIISLFGVLEKEDQQMAIGSINVNGCLLNTRSKIEFSECS